MLEYGNPDPDQAFARIVFKTTSTADAAYNDLTYYFSGNLTYLGIPEFRIHVHNAQSPEPEGTAGTNDRNMKVWFSIEPSIDSLGQAAVCAAEGGLWSDPHCVITSINACEKAYGAGTWDSVAATCGSTITAETACTASGNNWDGTTSTCGSTITAQASCEATTGNTWVSGTSTCSITAEAACLSTTGNTWNSGTCQSSGGSTIMAQASCEATTGNTWVTDTCYITAEKACLATTGNAWNSTTFTCSSITSEAACNAYGKNWDGTTSTCVSYIPAEFACEHIHEEWDSDNNICTIGASDSCLDSGNFLSSGVCGSITAEDACTASGNAWDGTTSTCSITAEAACLATTGNAWVTDTCQSSGGSTITAGDACTASGNTWDGTTSTCGSITAGDACTASGNLWNGSTMICYAITLEDACAATLYGTWDSANAKCVVMPERACEGARGVWNSNNSTCSISPKLACDTALHTWINKAEPVCAITNPQSHDSDITITYTVTDTADTASASAGEDYTVPATTTVTIPASSTSAYTEISLVADSVGSPSDKEDETFKVSITSVSTSGADLIVADADAIVTIGDPDKSSNYLFPNRPLMRGEKAADVVAGVDPVAGETPSFECYIVPEMGKSFSSIFPSIKINDSTALINAQINGNSVDSSTYVDLTQYRGEGHLYLLLVSTLRAHNRLFFAPGGSGYNPMNNHSYRCLPNFLTSLPIPIKNVPSGRFGMLEFGQAYEYK